MLRAACRPRHARHSACGVHLCLQLALLLCAGAWPMSPLAEELRVFDTTRIEALGRQLFEVRRRIEIAADLMAEHYEPEKEGIAMWVTGGTPARLRVRFLRAAGDAFEPAIDAHFENLLLPGFVTDDLAPLSAFELAQITARDAVAPYLDPPCSRRYESVALPDPDGGGMLLYALAVADSDDEVMLGGHHRFSVSADGQRVAHADALSTACTRAQRTELAAADGQSGMAVRANLSDTPLEVHVYLSLRYRLTLYVVTRDLRMWEVRDGRMRVIRQRPGELSSAARFDFREEAADRGRRAGAVEVWFEIGATQGHGPGIGPQGLGAREVWVQHIVLGAHQQ
jgi:hypothetical protein